jgi:hypothetical protein
LIRQGSSYKYIQFTEPDLNFQINALICSYLTHFGLSDAVPDPDPDPAYHFDADLDPDPAYLFDADPNPTF